MDEELVQIYQDLLVRQTRLDPEIESIIFSNLEDLYHRDDDRPEDKPD